MLGRDPTGLAGCCFGRDFPGMTDDEYRSYLKSAVLEPEVSEQSAPTARFAYPPLAAGEYKRAPSRSAAHGRTKRSIRDGEFPAFRPLPEDDSHRCFHRCGERLTMRMMVDFTPRRHGILADTAAT